MKFFTIFLSLILQFDIFTSNKLDLLFIMIHEVYLPTSGRWLSPIQHKNKIHPNMLCQYLRRAPLITIWYHHDRFQLQSIRNLWFLERRNLQNEPYKMSFVRYYDMMNKPEYVPTLACSFGSLMIHIARYSDYKDFVVFIKELHKSTYELIGTVKKPLNMKMIESNALKTFTDVFENRCPDSQLDNEEKPDTLFPLNDLDSSNLCASLYWHLFRNLALSDEEMVLRRLYKTYEYVINQKIISINLLLCWNTRYKHKEYFQFHVIEDPTKIRHIFVLHPDEDHYLSDADLFIVDDDLLIAQFEIL